MQLTGLEAFNKYIICSSRVRTGHGNLEKSWNFEIKIPGLEKSWNLKYCRKSWKGHGISNKSLKKAENLGNIRMVSKSNAMRKLAKTKEELRAIEQELQEEVHRN